MPEIDTDLFQVLALALLFLCLLALLAALSVLSGIKKQLDARSSSAIERVPQPTYSYDPTPTHATYAPPAVTTPALTHEVSTGFVSMEEATPTTPATSTTAAQPAAAGGLTGDEPEEQPFERDGRWWFKRGGELLVYDEGTGQWVASPGGPTGAAQPSTTSLSTSSVPLSQHADPGEGWKCSSCGAINGSTATSCRMCFTPR